MDWAKVVGNLEKKKMIYVRLIVRLKERRKKTDFKGKLEPMAVQFYQLFANSLR
jgi:hypothetical protein